MQDSKNRQPSTAYKFRGNFLFALVITVLFLGGITLPVLADGGDGGSSLTGTGAPGGTGFIGNPGGDGTNGHAGGGGGGGAGGGNGGAGGNGGGAGGAGGTSTTDAQMGGTNVGAGAGGGGGGGYNGNGSGTDTLSNSSPLTGGNGGAGGRGSDFQIGAGGGGGGAGGYGAVVTSGNPSDNSSTITGGNGGAGGNGGNSFNVGPGTPVGGSGGSGGDGGVGIDLTLGGTFTNSGTITGGNGSMGGMGGSGSPNGADGNVGLGGVGINSVFVDGVSNFGNLTIFNSGTISGGLAGDGITRADAIDFSSGGNTLAVEAGSIIVGNVVSTSGTMNGGDTLELTGATTGTFDVSQIGTQYQGFTNYLVTTPFGALNNVTWTLTGTTTALTPWTINGAILEVSSDAALGNTSGSVSLTNFGELLTDTDGFISNRSITVGSPDVGGTDSGVLAAEAGTTATYTGTISGVGTLWIGDGAPGTTATGTVILEGTNNTYGTGTGVFAGTTIGSGTLKIEADSTIDLTTGTVTGPVGNGLVSINPGGTLDIGAGHSVAVNGLLAFGGAFVDLENGSTLDVYVSSDAFFGTGSLHLDAVISSVTGTATFIKTGTGTLDLSGGGILNGTFFVDQGEVDLSGTGPFSNGTVLQVASGATFAIENNSAPVVGGLVATLGGDGTINLSGTNASLTLAGSGNAGSPFAGLIEGTGKLIVNGTGLVQALSGANTYSGGTMIDAGTLVVASNGALGAGDVALNGGTLTTTGNGTAQVINVGGNYTQSNGSTLTLNIYNTTNYDSVNLTGAGKTATLGGTLNLVFNTTTFTPNKGEQFTVVTTVGGIDSSVGDMYLNPETNLTALKLTATGSITDGGDDFVVTVVPIQQNFGVGNLTPNQRAVANNLNTYINNVPSGGNFSPLIIGLDQESGNPQSLASAFNQLMPLGFASFASSNAFNNASFTTQAFDNYLANHRGADGSFVGSQGGIDYTGLAVNDPNIDTGLQSVRSRLLAWSPAPSTGLVSDSSSLVEGGADMKEIAAPSGAANSWNVFVTGNVVLAQDFSDNQAGTPYASTTTGAVQIGVDYKITPHFLAGATFGYGHTHATLDTIGSNATVNTYSPGVYLSYSNSGWYFNALGSYGFADYSQNRAVSIGAFSGSAHSSPGGDQIVGNLDGGYDFHRGNWTFGPTLGLQYVHLDVDGYSETGLPGADLSVNENQSDSLRSVLGGRVSYAVKSGDMIFTPHLSASWQHEFMDQSRGITSQFNDLGAGSFVVNTANPSRESALVDAGFDGQITNTLTVFTDYAVQAGQSNYFGQSIQAGVKIGF